MIDPIIRLSYIGWASQFVLNKEEIYSVWVNKKQGITSVTELTNFSNNYLTILTWMNSKEIYLVLAGST